MSPHLRAVESAAHQAKPVPETPRPHTVALSDDERATLVSMCLASSVDLFNRADLFDRECDWRRAQDLRAMAHRLVSVELRLRQASR